MINPQHIDEGCSIQAFELAPENVVGLKAVKIRLIDLMNPIFSIAIAIPIPIPIYTLLTKLAYY